MNNKPINRRLVIGLSVLLLLLAPAFLVQAQSGDTPASVTHIVQRGETLFSIAQRYGTTVDAIAHANGLADPRQIYVGQQLIIPHSEADVIQEAIPYVVQPGDTVTSIARRYGTNWQTLAHINGMLSPSTLYVGQIIQVPDTTTPDSTVSLSRTGIGSIYIIRPTDTLYRISLRKNISPWMLLTINELSSPAMIYHGQKVVIPGDGQAPLPAPFAFVEVHPLPVSQGSAVIVSVGTTEPVQLRGRLFEQDMPFAIENGVYYGMIGVHVFTEPGLYKLTLTATDDAGQTTSLSTEVVIEAGSFGYERIDLPTDRTQLLDPEVIAAERERLEMLRGRYTPQRQWTTPFQRPCVGTISAYFGTHRAYNAGPYTSYHTGVDFRAPGGTPVYAPAAGIIPLAEPLTVRGNTIFIDHGWGILTGYWHLSSIAVEVGQEVEAGDLIGYVGNTGLSTGAHLHWEVWVGGVSVNGLQWLDDSFPQPQFDGLATGG